MSFKLYFSFCAIATLCGGSFLFAQDAPEQTEADLNKKLTQERLERIAEENAKTAKRAATGTGDSAEIKQRILELQKRQAEYVKRVAEGKVKPNADLADQWPKIQQGVFALRDQIGELNALDADDVKRPAVETRILSSLQELGLFLVSASHPKHEPRKLDAYQLNELKRLERAIADIEFGDRSKAKPVKLVTPSTTFTMIHLPVPIVLKSDPHETIYLSALNGGAFANGLSLIELQTDKNGLAQTTWTSIGEGIGTCDVSIHSQIGIEVQGITIEVVAPSLRILEGLPRPDEKLLSLPDRISSKIPKKK